MCSNSSSSWKCFFDARLDVGSNASFYGVVDIENNLEVGGTADLEGAVTLGYTVMILAAVE